MVKDFCNYTKSKTAIHNSVYIFQGFIAYLVSSALFLKKVDRLQAEKKMFLILSVLFFLDELFPEIITLIQHSLMHAI